MLNQNKKLLEVNFTISFRYLLRLSTLVGDCIVDDQCTNCISGMLLV